MISAASSALLVLGGVVAGVVGTAGGITSLVSYPVLLAAGVPALPASVANLVAATACWPGSYLTSRRELADVSGRMAPGLVAAAAGAAAGSALLLSTPPGVFSRLVPFLVAAGSVALLAQPWLTARRQRRTGPAVGGTAIMVAVGAVSIYSGYFGAGSGVLLLAVLLVLVDDRLPHANATKNMLLGASGVASSIIFIVVGPVEWAVILPLAVGLFAGSLVGPVVARHLPSRMLRYAVALLGLVLAVRLWLDPA